MKLQAYALGGLLAGLVAIGPAVAANPDGGGASGQIGTTSGPAAGTNVAPSTATNKGYAAGNPGMAGAPGNKNGPPARSASSQGGSSHSAGSSSVQTKSKSGRDVD
ncbi:MAG: hypothetical protein JOY66_17300 [Acetobacteraceae bacterium]|nr:hypothetical protein [Acetobacteraceae bacterium]